MQDIGVNYLPRVRRMVGGRAPRILIRDFVSRNVIPDKRFSEWGYGLHVQTVMENGDFGLRRHHQMLIVLVRSTRPSQYFFLRYPKSNSFTFSKKYKYARSVWRAIPDLGILHFFHAFRDFYNHIDMVFLDIQRRHAGSTVIYMRGRWAALLPDSF